MSHIRSLGYHFGKIPYGKRAVPAPENPRYRVLVEDPEEQAVLARMKGWAAEGVGTSEMAVRLNAEGVALPQGVKWTRAVSTFRTYELYAEQRGVPFLLDEALIFGGTYWLRKVPPTALQVCMIIAAVIPA